MPRVVVIGSANVDFTVRLSRLPQVGETVSEGEFYRSFGGKGANQAVAAMRAGAEVRLLAKLGADLHGRQLREHLETMGLPPQYLLADPKSATGTALILVDGKGRNLIGVAPGANHMLTEHEVRSNQELFEWGEVLLLQLEIPIPAVLAALQMGKARDMCTILNPAPLRNLPREALALVDLITPNEGEAAALAQVQAGDVEGAARRLSHMGPGCVVVTLGERGAMSVCGPNLSYHPAYEVEAVDTTGCGDAFNGALACGLAEGKSLDEALRFANAAGALAATKKGAQHSLPWRDQIQALMEKDHGESRGGS